MDKFGMLVYGPPNAGKSAFGVSAYCDWKTGKQHRSGRWLLFGGEDNNPALVVPEDTVKRFTSPLDDPLKFAKEFSVYMRAVVKASRDGSGPEVLVFDGFSEWNTMLTHGHEQVNGLADRWARWDYAKASLLDTMQLLNPRELKAWVIGTARVDTRRKAIENKRGETVVEGDPEWMEIADYYPAMQGWAGKNISHYFPFVLYMQQEDGNIRVGGKLVEAAVHKLYAVKAPRLNAWVKNTFEHKWLAASLPNALTNPTFDDFLERLGGLDKA